MIEVVCLLAKVQALVLKLGHTGWEAPKHLLSFDPPAHDPACKGSQYCTLADVHHGGALFLT